MSRFPVSTQRDINEIILTEGIPFSLSRKDTIASPSPGTNITVFDFTFGSGSYQVLPWGTAFLSKITFTASRDISISIRVDDVATLQKTQT